VKEHLLWLGMGGEAIVAGKTYRYVPQGGEEEPEDKEDTTIYYDNTASLWDAVYVSWLDPETNETVVKQIQDPDGDGIFETKVYSGGTMLSFGPTSDQSVVTFSSVTAGRTYKYTPPTVTEDTTIYYDNSASRWEQVYVNWANPRTGANEVKEVFDTDGDGLYEATIYGQTPSASFGPSADVKEHLLWIGPMANIPVTAGETYSYTPPVPSGAGDYEAGDGFGTNDYYTVISTKDYTLVPGAAYEYEMVLNNAAGNRRQVIHVIEVDPSNPDVSIVPGYYQIDKDVTTEAYWSHKELTEMAKYYEDNLGYNIVGGMNTDLYYDTYAPRVLVYNGRDLSVKGKTAPSSSILYVFKDANGNVSCEVTAFNRAEFDKYLADGILLHAVGVSFGMVVKDSELVSKTEERTSAPAARSMVGVKEDGTLVICMNDGRGANNSVGYCNYEEGEAMLALGCKWAANCDGGGSSTFLTKRAGESTFTMRSVPCDGAQRPTAHGIFVASNVGPTGVLNNVDVESEYDFFAPKTEYTFGAEAIDTHGYAMAMPEDASWALSDDTFGTIEDGKFVSNGTKGTVDIQVISGEKVVGSKTITVADPEVFELSANTTVIPYSTAEKPRTITVPIVAMIGEADVYVDTNAVSISLSDKKAGKLEGFDFTATTDTTITGVDLTVTYGETTLTYAVSFGKGSEIIYNFEDGSKAGFMGFEEAKAWSKENGVNNTLVGADPLAGQFNEYLSSETFIASAENGGQVRSGEYSLAWRLDNTDAAFASWSYNVLFNTGETIVLRDVENDMLATTLGMWVYIPEEAFQAGTAGVAFQSQLYVKNADGSYSCKQDHFMFTSAATGKQTNLNSATNADVPESRWVYATIDISKYDYLCTPVATDEGNSRSPSFIRTYVKPTFPANITFYIDDITLDYSSAVDDRILPVISSPTYSTSDTAIGLTDGAVISGSKFAFSATVSDNAGLNNGSGKIYVDGIALSAAIAGNTLSSKGDVALIPGVHTVTFEVNDAMGNPRKLTRTFTVSGTADVELTGHNDSGETAKAQSIYYVDIDAADLSKVSEGVFKLKLNNANRWETMGAVVADGFEASFQYNTISELLTVTVKKGSNSVASGNTLVSIPVRVWTYDRYDYVNETYVAVSGMGNKPVVDIECDVVYGQVTFADGTTSPVGGSIDVATELTTISSPYHVHDAELTALDKEANCMEAGYTGRTYCETCKSVVSWGTILNKQDHDYAIVDAKFVCQNEACGHVYESGTGVFEMNGDLYYSINGELKTGWQTVDGGYGFAGSDHKLYVGEKAVNGITYVFDENGCTKGAWTTNATGTRFSFGPGFYTRMWVEMDGKTYYFGRDSYMFTGIRFVKDNPDTPAYWYIFAEDGSTNKNVTVADGLYEVDGEYYVVENGMTASGIYYIDGHYYCGGIGSGFERFGCVAKDREFYVSADASNGLIPSGYYQFGSDGKMVINHGVVGDYFYDENGFMVHAYQLVELNGDYYFVNDYHKIARNKSIYLTSALMGDAPFQPGYFEFDADGKMVLQNGPAADGYLYFNGVKQLGWKLYEYEGDHYYVAAYNKYVTGKTTYLDKTVLEGTPFQPGYFEFDADGKMVLQNGPSDDGYFYIDGVKQLGWKVYEFEGDHYYVAAYNKYVTGKTTYLDKTVLEGTPFQPGYFEFDADGKMVLQNGPSDDGYFYIDGVKQLGWKVYEFEGDHYYVAAYNKYVTGKTTYLDKTVLEGTPFQPGYFEFDAEGKLVLQNGPSADGYFYIDGVKQLGWKVYEFEGDYYYVAANNKYVTGKSTYLDKTVLEGTPFKPGNYEFDAAGKMIVK